MGHALILKTTVIVSSLLLFGIGGTYLGLERKLFLSLFLAGVSVALNSINRLFCSIFLAFEKAEFESTAVFLEKTLVLVFGLFALIEGFGLVGIFAAYSLSRLVTLFWIAILYHWKIPRKRFRFTFRKLRELFLVSLPFALNIVLGVIAFKVDILMLKGLCTSQDVGLYSAAITLITGVAVVGEMYKNAVYPVMSRQFEKEHEALKRTLRKSVEIVFLMAVPFSITTFVHAEFIIEMVFGKNYAEAAKVLRLLALSLPFVYVSQVLGITLTAINHQSVRPIVAAIVVVLNIMLNLLLIPHLGIVGAAMATTISTVALMFIFTYLVGKYCVSVTITRPIMHTMVGGLVMLSLSIFGGQIPVAAMVAISIIAYLLVHYFLGSLSCIGIDLSALFSFGIKASIENKK